MRRSVFRFDCVSVASGYTLQLSEFDLEIREGEIMGVVGPSDSGKTSLCHVLTGENRCCGGRLFYRDRQIREARVPKEIAGRVALIENSSTLAPSLKVSELLALVNPKRGGQLFLNKSWTRGEAERVLGELSIGIDPEMKAVDLTAAQRHLVLIAGAYLQRAELIALNNTVSGYTDQEWAEILRALRAVMGGRTAILLTSNRVARLTEACDHIAVLERGANIKVFEPQGYDTLRRALAVRRGRSARREPVSAPRERGGGAVVFRASQVRTKSIRGGAFELRRGEITGFYDPSNVAGQELFAELMHMEPDSGRFELEGQRLSGMNAVKCMKRGIGFITDDAVSRCFFSQLSVMDNLLCSSREKLGAAFLFHRRALNHLAATYASAIGIDRREMRLKGEHFDSLERLRIYLRRWDFVRLKLLFCSSILETADLDAGEELKLFLRSVAAKGAAVGLFGYDRSSLLEVCDSVYVIENERLGAGPDQDGESGTIC